MKQAALIYYKGTNLWQNWHNFTASNHTHIPHLNSRPCSLSIEVASSCNLHCPECPVGLGQINRKHALMPFPLYESLMKEVGPWLHTLIFYFQGEPLINPELERYITLARDYKIYTQTSTNAQLLTPSRAERLVQSGLHKLIISLDGITQQTYEKYRKGGRLEDCKNALRYMQEAKKKYQSKTPIIEAQMLAFSFNEHELEAFKHTAKQWGADTAVIKTAQIYDYKHKFENIPHQVKYARYIQKEGTWQLKKPIQNKCYRLWSGAVITSDGDVLPCCFDKNAEHSFGNLSTQSFLEIWHGTKAQNFRQQVLNNRASIAICTNCTS